ncbi:baseplate J/gp47 family protein [Paraherbaspirillum soli]|uniref:Baseplate J/gp47 family protein n=1 Tax=Paraherbaspirillum soli TaxID=631222 RepID=A0ABW0MCA5_9BURK
MTKAPTLHDLVAFDTGGHDPAAIAPQSFLVSSSGAVTYSGGTLTIPAQVAVLRGNTFNIAQQTLTPTTPSLTLATIDSGTVTLVQTAQILSKFNVTVSNASGNAVSGSLTVNGLDERGYVLSDVVTIASVANGNSATTASNKYLASITGIAPISGTLGNPGVTITLTEKQFRNHLKINSSGTVVYASDNTYAADEVKLATFEVVSTGILSVQDWRLLGAIPKAQRVGSEIVDWSGGTAEGPPSWLGNCIYVAAETLDGHLIISGNGGLISEWDGQTFITTLTCPGLVLADNITAICNVGLNIYGHEIIFFGTSTGKIIRWDRTSNSYGSIRGTPPSNVNKMVKASGSANAWVMGSLGFIGFLSESGSSASLASYTSNASFSAGGDAIYDGVYTDRHLYAVGGSATGLKFHSFNLDTFQGSKLGSYLPGTTAQLGGSGSSTAIFGIGFDPTSRKLLLAGFGASLYIAEWDTTQQYATGSLQFTTSSATTIPAGTVVSSGMMQYQTTETAVVGSAATITVPAIAQTAGFAALAAVSTVTTLVSAVANVTAVTNPTPFGMGRLIASGGSEDLPNGLLSSTPLAVAWSGTQWLIAMQGGDVLSFDGTRLTRLTDRFSFKGRATGILKTTRCTWLFGDEGRLFSMPH